MTNNQPIGRVVATEKHPTSTGSFRFWLTAGVNLKPFDFVRVLPPENTHIDIGNFYAIIDEIHQVSDEPSPLSSFISSDFGNSQQSPRVARVVTTYADATVLYNTNDIEMPVPHGARVYYPDELGVRKALGIDEYRRNTPAGYITMSGPDDRSIVINVDMDADYLIGPEGAHLNISGISGLATKTSYAMFILSAIQQRQRSDTWPVEEQASFVVLNVKGSDLLYLHEPAEDMNKRTQDDWERCQLRAEPLQNVTYFYPYAADSKSKTQTKLQPERVASNVDSQRAFRYFYDVENALDRLRLLFEDMDDPNATLVSCADHCVQNVDPDDPWSTLRTRVAGWAKQTPDKKIPVVSWRRFHRLFGQRTRNGIFTELGRRSDELKQVRLSDRLRALQPGHIAVVDIAQLPDYLQAFVVGDVIAALREPQFQDASDHENEETTNQHPIILFADELNKFAPRQGGTRSLTRHLREISERGRSEGIILFGAEQFRTSVDDRVTGNSGTHVFGRTTAVESQKDPEIRSRPQSKRVPFLRKANSWLATLDLVPGHSRSAFPVTPTALVDFMSTTPNTTLGVHLLETITLGMYSQPLHCVREYIQNAFDSIRAARRQGLLDIDDGCVDVIVDADAKSLRIRDNGTGLAPEEAVVQLVDIGYSAKASSADTAATNAGFRGIGRMAGISYCASLVFETTDGAGTTCLVTFDAQAINQLTRPGQEPTTIVEAINRNCTVIEQVSDSDARFLQVSLEQVTDNSLLDVDALSEYLEQTAPVRQDPTMWKFQEKIRSIAQNAGCPSSLDTISVRVCRPDGSVIREIYRPFKDSFVTKNAKVKQNAASTLQTLFRSPEPATTLDGGAGWPHTRDGVHLPTFHLLG